MSKFDEAIAVSICEFLCGHAKVSNACRAHNISTSTYWTWLAKSRRDPPDCLPEITWLGMQAPFWKHVQNARQIFANFTLEAITERARFGSERRLTYQGKEMFMVDPSIPPDPALDADPELCMILYGVRDRYLRDNAGRMIHLTEKVEPPVALQLAVAAASFAAYQPHSSQHIEVTQRGDIGVRHVGGPPKAEPVLVEHKEILPPAAVPEPTSQRASEAPRAEVFAAGAEIPVEAPKAAPADDRVTGSKFYIPPPANSSKIPEGRVPVFNSAAMADDPPEVIEGSAAPADPPPAVRPPTPDIMLHLSVRAAMLKNHNGERAGGAVEAQIMRALTLQMTPEQRERRLRELVGDFRDADDRSERLGAGTAEAPKGVKMI